jgi:drug/metabolite transporter (DMT)-like permease
MSNHDVDDAADVTTNGYLTMRERTAMALVAAAVVYPFFAQMVPGLPSAQRDGITPEEAKAVAYWVVGACLIAAAIAVPPWRWWTFWKRSPVAVGVTAVLSFLAVIFVKNV